MGACRGCGAENGHDAQFCASCGAALAPVCPSCGASARADARFCDRCGTELIAGAHGSGAQARKVVTVLFADLVGSTAAQETMDPESVRRWIDRYYAVLRAEVESHGGRVVKFIGDGMMAVFGVPDVREDDADRAVAAAQAMHEAVAELGSTVVNGAAIGLRVGVNTGEVVVTADDDDVVGDAVNVAARLEQAARPGEVLVGDATFRLVRTRAQLRAVPPLELKGKAEPVPAFLLLSLTRPEDDTATSPFVGRAGELERLAAVLDGAIDDRRPQLASIVGAPGVGKSRLVQQLGTAAAGRARVVVVRCDPAGGATFAPVATAIRVAASLDDDATDETVLAGLTALFDETEPDRHRIATCAAAILGVGEPGLPEETFWAVRRLIENAAQRGPLVFVFEDVHWAEPLLIDLIENLATFARDVPVLMVVTARPELRELRPALVEVGGRVTAAIHLEGLAVDESRRLTRALLDGASLPTALLDRVASASEGNPLFVRELVRMLVDDGVLRQHDGSWTAAVDARTIEVPLSIHSVLAARIDRLPPGEQEVLSAASVMGRTFARGAVLHLVSPEVAAHLDDHLEGLRRKELVERAGTYWLDEPQLRFHHALVQDAAYRRLLKEVRAELHTKAAAWLEAKVGDLAEHDDLIGYQLEQAHLLRTEAGEGDEGVGRAAAERLRQAGRRALEADDRPGAAALLGRALTCLPDDDSMQAELLIERCEALLAMGDVTDATPSVAALAALAPGEARLEGWVACFEGELANLRDPRHLEATAERSAAAAVTLADLGDHAGVAKAHSVRAASLARLGRIGECERALDQALGAARAAGDRRRATAILAGAPTAALWGPNPVTRASGRCLDVVRVLRITSRAPAVEAISLRCQAVLEALRGRDDAARRMLASARSSLEELGHALGLIEVDLAAGMVETLAGDLDTAAKLLERAFEGFHELGIDVDAGLAAALLARVRIAQGAPVEALELTLESERLGGDDLKTAIAWRSVRAAALADEGDLVEARRLAEEAVALAAPTDALVDHADALVALAEVLAHTGEEAASQAAARQALELYDRKEASVPANHARWLVGDGSLDAPVPPIEAVRADSSRRVALGLTRPTIATELAERVLAATSPFDRSAMGRLLAPDLVSHDHRPLVGSDEPLDALGTLESIQTVYDIGVREVRGRVLAARGAHLVLIEASFILPASEDAPDGGHLEILQVFQAAPDGRLRQNLIYDPEQEAEAWAELERLHLEQTEPAEGVVERGPRSGNRATTLNSELIEFGFAGRFDEVAVRVRSDLRISDHRPIVGGIAEIGRERYIDLCGTLVEVGVTSIEQDIRGLRGESLALGVFDYRGEGGSTVALVIVEVDEDGLLAANDMYELDQYVEAWAELERRSCEQLPPAEARVWSACSSVTTAMAANDWAGIQELLPPGFVGVDHRPGGWGTVDRDEFVGLYRVVEDLAPGSLNAVPDVHLVTGCGAVCSAERRGTTVDGGEFQTEATVSFQVVDGQVVHLEFFLADRPDLAISHLRSLEGTTNATNRSTVERTITELVRATVASDWDTVRCGTAPQAVYEDLRTFGARRGPVGLDDLLIELQSLVSFGVTKILVSLAAPVGDLGAVFEFEFSGSDGLQRMTQLEAATCNPEGLILSLTSHDLARLDDAVAEIQRRIGDQRTSSLTAAPIENDVTRKYERAIRLALAGDDDAFSDVREDLVSYDHRPILGGGDVIHGSDTARTWVDGLAEIGFDTAEMEVIAIRGERLGLVLSRRLADEATLEVLTIAEADEQGLACRIDVYDKSQMELAMERLDERHAQLVAEGIGGHVDDGNEAVRIHSTAFDRALAGDWDAMLGAMAPDVVFADLRPLLGGVSLSGHEGAKAFAGSVVASGVRSHTTTTVAMRGDRLALLRNLYEGERGSVEVLTVIVTDGGGHISEVGIYDPSQLDGAFTRLDELFLAGEGADREAWRLFVAALDYMNSRDLDGLRDMTREDFVAVDHRPLGWGEVDRMDFIAMYPPMFERAPDVRWRLVTDKLVTRQVAVGEMEVAGGHGVGDAGGFELRMLGVLRTLDGQGAGLELYPVEDEAAALARAHDILAEGSGTTSILEGAFRELGRLSIEGDVDATMAFVAPGFAIVERRPLFAGETFAGADVATAIAAFGSLGIREMDMRAVATRGERLLLTRSVFRGSGGEVEALIVGEVDDEGRPLAMVNFDPDQMDEALAEMDARFRSGDR